MWWDNLCLFIPIVSCATGGAGGKVGGSGGNGITGTIAIEADPSSADGSSALG